MKKGLIFLLLVVGLMSCHRVGRVVEATGEIILIDSTMDALQDSSYMAYIAPIKQELEDALNVPIGYAPEALSKDDEECSILQWATEALWAIAQQLYPGRVDMAVVNRGGMRTDWSAGDITRRHVFELMPFDNELVVLTLTGDEVLKLCAIALAKGEGLVGVDMRVVKGSLVSASIDGKTIDPAACYTVATSDYLSQGNDGLIPLSKYIDYWRSEEKIRELYIEYIEKVKTVKI